MVCTRSCYCFTYKNPMRINQLLTRLLLILNLALFAFSIGQMFRYQSVVLDGSTPSIIQSTKKAMDMPLVVLSMPCFLLAALEYCLWSCFDGRPCKRGQRFCSVATIVCQAVPISMALLAIAVFTFDDGIISAFGLQSSLEKHEMPKKLVTLFCPSLIHKNANNSTAVQNDLNGQSQEANGKAQNGQPDQAKEYTCLQCVKRLLNSQDAALNLVLILVGGVSSILILSINSCLMCDCCCMAYAPYLILDLKTIKKELKKLPRGKDVDRKIENIKNTLTKVIEELEKKRPVSDYTMKAVENLEELKTSDFDKKQEKLIKVFNQGFEAMKVELKKMAKTNA